MRLKDYFKKTGITYQQLIDKARELNPDFELSIMALSRYCHGRRPQELEIAYWISKATDGKVSINDLCCPQDEIEKIESKVGNSCNKARAA